MTSVKDIRVGDVFLHRGDVNYAWLVLELKEENTPTGRVARYCCLDLVDGTTAWSSNYASSVVDSAWELVRP